MASNTEVKNYLTLFQKVLGKGHDNVASSISTMKSENHVERDPLLLHGIDADHPVPKDMASHATRDRTCDVRRAIPLRDFLPDGVFWPPSPVEFAAHQ